MWFPPREKSPDRRELYREAVERRLKNGGSGGLTKRKKSTKPDIEEAVKRRKMTGYMGGGY